MAARPKGSEQRPNAKRPRKVWTAAEREDALALLAQEGARIASRTTGVPVATLHGWGRVAGVEGPPRDRAAEIAHAQHGTALAVQGARLSTVALLEDHIDRAGHYLSVVTAVNEAAALAIAATPASQLVETQTAAGMIVVPVEGSAAREAVMRSRAIAALSLGPRDAVGIITRAIHDLALLRGEATERGVIVVEHQVPRPDPGDVIVIEQDQLAVGPS